MSADGRPGNWRAAMFAHRHPIATVVVSAALMYGWSVGVIRLSSIQAGVAAVVVGVLQAILWSPKGWARRRTQRYLDTDGNT